MNKTGMCIGGPWHGRKVISQTPSFTVCCQHVASNVWYKAPVLAIEPNLTLDPKDGGLVVRYVERIYDYDPDLDAFVCRAPDLPRVS